MADNKKQPTSAPKQSDFAFAFDKINYILMGVGLVILLIGYLLLRGGGSDDPNVFNPEMFNTQRLVVSPIFIVFGFIVEIVAIMYKPRQKSNKE